MDLVWSDKARSMVLPTSNHGFEVSNVLVNYTQVISLGFGILVTVVTAAFLRFSNLGTAMRALANDREITATLGVPVRRVEAAAWLGSGLLSGAAGLLLSNLVGARRHHAHLPGDLVAGGDPDRALRGRSYVTFVAAMVVGLINALVTPILSISQYRDVTPFVLATIALLLLTGRRGERAHGQGQLAVGAEGATSTEELAHRRGRVWIPPPAARATACARS